MHVTVNVSKPIECTTLKVIPNVNCGLWVIVICVDIDSSVVIKNKGTTLHGDIDGISSSAHVGAGRYMRTL